MARPHIAATIRRVIIKRALDRCEYCLLPAEWAGIPHHIDHIVPLKHGGAAHEENLAYACFECNLAKGSDIAAFDPLTGDMTRLFHPRLDEWSTHFRLDKDHLIGMDAIGRATAHLLHFNEPPRVQQRNLLIAADAYGL